jgi:hypothetical protein
MRQLAGTKTRYRRAHATPLAGLISGRAEYNSLSAGVFQAEGASVFAKANSGSNEERATGMVARIDVYFFARPSASANGELFLLTSAATNGNEAHDACTEAEDGEGRRFRYGSSRNIVFDGSVPNSWSQW